jgi:hypothetical protein
MAVTADPWDCVPRSHSTQCAERRAQLFGKQLRGAVTYSSGNRWISFAGSLAFEQLREQTDRDLGFQLIDVPAGALAERTAPIQRISRELVSRKDGNAKYPG